ncbi:MULTISPECIES: hypothetical protein [unclassified Jeotgalibaca]|uniref:hypothetical protein n=1 Tax=unclassified Jeotgalibaca TaxID=2621505 RepID=UPI003FD1A92F
MTAIMISYLFNLLIFAFVLVIWVTFIRNLIRSARKDTRQTTKRNQWDKAPITKTVRQVSVDSAQTYSRSQSRRTNQSQTQTRNKSWQELLSDNPQELYQLLRDNLPDSYEEEIKAIFKSQRPMMELMKFLRRKDVWPVLQSLPRKIKTPDIKKGELFQTQKDEQSIASPYLEEEQPFYDETSDLDKDAVVLSQEIDAVINEYDGYAAYFGSLLNEVPKSSVETWQSISTSRNTTSGTKGKKLDKKWLRDAVIATVILEKPEY